MQANVDFNYMENCNYNKEDCNFLSPEDKKILQSLKETLFFANKVKQQTEELNKSLSSKKYSLGFLKKWKK